MNIQSKKVRIFISGPGDVENEREIAFRVLKKFERQYQSFAEFDIFISKHFPSQGISVPIQFQLPDTGNYDIFICIFWSRMGTPLPEVVTSDESEVRIAGPDGQTKLTGTEYEFLWALHSWKQKGFPRVMVYRKKAHPSVSIETAEQTEKFLQEQRRVEDFERRFISPDGTYISAQHTFLNDQEFEELFSIHAKQLIKDLLKERGHDSNAVDHAKPPAVWSDRCPFRGLSRFESWHSDIFFGRERLIHSVARQLETNMDASCRFLLLLGASGSGKSSLVRAGLIPYLKQKTENEFTGHLFEWFTSTVSLDTQLSPSIAIVDQLTNAWQMTEGEGKQPSLWNKTNEEVALQLIKDPGFIAGQMLAAISKSGSARENSKSRFTETRLLLFIDQFEQLFDNAVPEQEREAVCHFIRTLATNEGACVITTLRSDYYAHFHEQPILRDLTNQSNRIDVHPPNPAEIESIIRNGAAAAGLTFAEEKSGFDLADSLMNNTAKEPNCLPLLSLCLEQVYRTDCVLQDVLDKQIDLSKDIHERIGNELKRSTYDKMGGLKGAIDSLGMALNASLSSKELIAYKNVFWQLVQLPEQGQKPISRSVNFERFPEKSYLRSFIAKCVEKRLFTIKQGSSKPDKNNKVIEVQLSHELLLTHWPLLDSWVKENHILLPMRSRLENAATRWNTTGRRQELLLPAGLPTEEAEQLELARVPLSKTAREFISDSRNRNVSTKRVRTIIKITTVFAVISAVIGLAFYVDGYVLIRPKYYENYILRWGIPVGINEFSEDSQKYKERSSSFIFVRKGRYGQLTHLVSFKGDLTGPFNVSSPVKDIKDRNPEIAPFSVMEFDYSGVDNLGRPQNLAVIHKNDMSDSGALAKIFSKDLREISYRGSSEDLDTILHMPVSGPNLFMQGSIIDGEPRSTVSKQFVSYFNDGCVKQIKYLDSNNQPASNDRRVYGYRYERNRLGLISRETSLNRQGNPINNARGYAIREFKYDNNNRVKLIRYLNEKDELFRSPQRSKLSSQEQIQYDSIGNVVQIDYLDHSDQPHLNERGFSSIRFGHQRGELTLTEFIGKNNKLVDTTDGIAKIKRSFSQDGKQISFRYYDANRQKVLLPDSGVHLIRVTNDAEVSDSNQVISQVYYEEYFDTEDRSCISKKTGSFARKQTTYFKPKHVEVTEMFYDKNGKIMLRSHSGGVAGSRLFFTRDTSQIIKEEYLGIDGELTINPDTGIAYNETTYDKFGNVKEMRNYGANRELKADKSGIAIVRFQYLPETNFMTEKSYLNEKRELVIASDEGYAQTKLLYDPLGNLTERQFLNSKKELINQHETGIARQVMTYKGVGRLTDIRFFNAQGKLAVNQKEGYASEIREYDEESGELIASEVTHGNFKHFVVGANSDGLTRTEYDSLGRTRKIICFNHNRNKVLGDSGFHELKIDYDEFESPLMEATSIDGRVLHPSSLRVVKVLKDEQGDTLGFQVDDLITSVEGTAIQQILGDDFVNGISKFNRFRADLPELHTVTVIREKEEIKFETASGILGLELRLIFTNEMSNTDK